MSDGELSFDTFRDAAVLSYEKKNLEELEKETGLRLEAAQESKWFTKGFYCKMGKVIQIGLGAHKLSEFPRSLFAFRHLRRLKMMDCGLKEIPSDIYRLETLVELSIEMNELEELPDSIGNLKNLQILRLHDNRLKHIPESIGNLKKLRLLKLSYNPLESIPESIGNLESLRMLIISEDQLPLLSESLKRKLEESGCEIRVDTLST